MSLKAKIEAVIYASEEPVTLAQLAGLLGEEAQAELDARAAEQASLALEQAAGADTPEAADAETPTEPNGDDQPVADDVAPHEATPENVAAAAEATASSKDEQAKAIAAEAKARERKLRAYFREILDELIKDYSTSERGLEVREVAGGFRLATKPEYHDAVRGFVKQLKPPLKLSLQALETLAVIAYKQPVTAPEISEIRGVDSSGVLGSLIARKLIQTAGRKQVIGRPMLYKTSKEFLVRFGLKDISELPSIEEFEKMAGELNDAVQEEIPMGGEEQANGGSPAVDEINSAPDNDKSHESPEELMSDRPEGGEGAAREHVDPSEVEPMADVHDAQADGVPDDHTTGNEADNIIVDGRNVGIARPEQYQEEDIEDSPELDAEVQSGQKES